MSRQEKHSHEEPPTASRSASLFESRDQRRRALIAIAVIWAIGVPLCLLLVVVFDMDLADGFP